MAGDNERETSVLRQEIDSAIVEARQARSKYHILAAEGRGGETTRELRSAAIQLHNAISQWRNREEVKEVWKEYDVDQFAQLLNQTMPRYNRRDSRLSSPGKTKQQLAVAQLGPGQLATVIEGLLESAKELGFAPETRERTPLEKGTIEDVRWLVNTRKQEKSVEELEPPENNSNEIRTDGGVAAQPGADRSAVSPEEPEINDERFPFVGPFFQLVSERKRKGQDAKIAVASANAETGVGKSTCALYLAHVLDTSSGGFEASRKATLNVDSYLDAYNRLDKGSAVILDEAEQLTKRRATSKKNVKASEKLQMQRVKEITALFTLPKFDVLDPLVKDLLDFRIEIERLGKATIYRKQHSPFSGTWWQEVQQFEFPSMDWSESMQTLHQAKDEFLESDHGGLVSENDAEKQAEKQAAESARQMRDETIRELSEDGLTYPEIRQRLEKRVDKNIMSEDLLVSTQRIGQIARGEA